MGPARDKPTARPRATNGQSPGQSSSPPSLFKPSPSSYHTHLSAALAATTTVTTPNPFAAITPTSDPPTIAAITPSTNSASASRTSDTTTAPLQMGAAGGMAGDTGGVLRLAGTTSGTSAVFLLDTGASADFLSASLARRLGATIKPSNRAIRLADGTTTNATGIATVRCSLATVTGRSVRFTTAFYVTELQGYDAILGMSWFSHHNPVIDWQRRTISLSVGHPKAIRHLQPLPSGLQPAVTAAAAEAAASNPPPSDDLNCVSHSQLKRMMRSKDVEMMAFLVRPLAPPSVSLAAAATEPPPPAPSTAPSAKMKALLAEFADVLPKELPAGLPPSRGVEHAIELTPGSKPASLPMRRYSTIEHAEMEKQVAIGIERGHIRPSVSPFGAMVLFVKKKDGTLRMCVDYRALNNQTIKNRYALPLPEDLFDKVQGAKYFSKLDLNSGFNQIRVADGDIHKTAFRTQFGHFEYTVLPMGLCNAPATFMNMMNTVFRDELGRFVLVFLDDILVFSATEEEHLQHLRVVLEKLRRQRLFAKPSKCDWSQPSVEFLGHRVGRDGLAVMADKIKAITEWPTPKTVTDVRSFLGLAGYYRKFVQGFSQVATPLSELTKEDVEWHWGPAQQESMAALQRALTSAPVLALADPHKPYTLNIDASGFAIGGTLQQENEDGQLQPVAYWSQKMKPAETRYAVHEQELLALVQACRHWRHYLHGLHPFTIMSDHHSLRYFTTQPVLSNRQARWKDELASFDFVIKYIEGPKNVVADAMSRRFDHKQPAETVSREAFLGAISIRDSDTMAPPSAAALEARAAALGGRRKQPPPPVPDTPAEASARQRFAAAAEKNMPEDSAEALALPAPNAKGAVVTPSQRCTATTKTGAHCRQQTAVGQYCFNHRRIISGVRIKVSGVPNGGKGLFATREFAPGERIALYTGVYRRLRRPNQGGQYVLSMSKTTGIDAAATNTADGRWANDPKGTGKPANATLALDHRHPKSGCLRAVSRIRVGEEILVPYGVSYWRCVGPRARKVGPRAIDEVAGNIAAATIGAPVTQLMNDIRVAANNDSEYTANIRSPPPDVVVRDGLLWSAATGALLVPDSASVRTAIIRECHDAATGGHFGRDKTLAAVRLRVEFKGMAAMVEQYVATCDVCQRTKPSQQLTPGRLMPLPVPEEIDSHWTMDFVTGLPKTARGFDSIQGHFSRGGAIKRLAATKETAGGVEASRLFIDSVVRHHGLPASIVSDRDPRFTGHFWQQFWKRLGTTLSMSTAYHPQTDGRSEREQRTMTQYLRSFCAFRPTDWDEMLPLAELAMNSMKQASTGQSPFFLLYGREPATALDRALTTGAQSQSLSVTDGGVNPVALERHQRMKQTWQHARAAAGIAQQRMAVNADRHRRQLRFQVGDQVMLSTRHLRFKVPTSKLSAVYAGPFKVLEVINANAYRLELPPALHIHDVINITLLKPYKDGTAAFPHRPVAANRPPPEAVDSNGAESYEVDYIAAARRGQFLVVWKGYPVEEATWQQRSDLTGAAEAIAAFYRRQQGAESLPDTEAAEDDGATAASGDNSARATTNVGSTGATGTTGSAATTVNGMAAASSRTTGMQSADSTSVSGASSYRDSLRAAANIGTAGHRESAGHNGATSSQSVAGASATSNQRRSPRLQQ